MNGPSSWIGTTYGLWQAAEDESVALAKELQKTDRSLDQWKQYAQRLNLALENVSNSHRAVNEMFIDKAGAERGQSKLKEAALEEIQRLDPANKLLDPAYRKAIYEKEKEARINELKKK